MSNHKYINPVAFTEKRLAMGYTLKDVAERARVDYTAVRMISNGAIRMLFHAPYSTIQRIAELLKCKPIDLAQPDYPEWQQYALSSSMASHCANAGKYSIPPVAGKNHKRLEADRSTAAIKYRAKLLRVLRKRYRQQHDPIAVSKPDEQTPLL